MSALRLPVSWQKLLNSEVWGASPVWHVVLPTVAAIGLAVVATAVYLPAAMQSAALDSAYRANLEVADQIKITRGYYTRRVVAKAIASGTLTPSYDHMNDPKAIPLPATFVQDISDLLQKKDTTLSLISPYPWPHRAERRMDEFQTMAWRAFQENPDAVFSREETHRGKRVLRVAVADRMTGETCVNCHNSHPLSAKRDWKVGDVRAVMEVTKVVEPYLAAVESRSRMIIGSLGATALVVALVLFFIARLVVRRAREKQLADRHVHYLAHHDGLTGALNRNSFGRQFDQILQSQRQAGSSIAVHYIDLDGFKDVNDKFGHETGDQLVCAVANRLRKVIGPHDLLARLGGDEFVLAQRIGSQRDATDCACAIVAALAAPFDLEHHQVCISASVGVMLSSGQPERADDLLKGADVALYRAKRSGRNRFVFFSQDMREELDARRRLEQTIRDATENDGFDLHFQPIWNVARCRLDGFEALLRLREPSGGFISPAVFIPVAEQIGLIGRIGAWVIEQACAMAATWPEDLTIAVNLSPMQFRDTHEDTGRICDVVRGALARSGLRPGRLELEVTEGLLLESTDDVLAELEDLNRMGVSLVMDDFGAGYSSLNYLWKFPFAKIKIDRAFVAASAGAAATIAAIAKTIVSLARTLGMQVTVEGVETSEQVALFAEVGCDQLQGFYLGRPLPAINVAAAILSDFCRDERTPGKRREKSPIRAVEAAA